MMPATEQKLIGVFYFERTENGNLIGEFSNNKSDKIMAESAMKETPSESLDGVYKSAWFDDDFGGADLTITKKRNKFILSWTTPEKKIYSGEGFLTNNKLIGWYEML